MYQLSRDPSLGAYSTFVLSDSDIRLRHFAALSLLCSVYSLTILHTILRRIMLLILFDFFA